MAVFSRSKPDSVRILLAHLKAGNQGSLSELWDRCSANLVEMAREFLRGRETPAFDEDDLIQEVLIAFYFTATRLGFSRLDSRDDVLQIMKLLTKRRGESMLLNERRVKRGSGRRNGSGVEEIVGDESLPDVTAMVRDLEQHLKSLLENEVQREIVNAKGRGEPNGAIAVSLGVSLATVNRTLWRIRFLWERALNGCDRPPPPPSKKRKKATISDFAGVAHCAQSVIPDEWRELVHSD